MLFTKNHITNLFIVLFFFLLSSAVLAQDTARIMCYNLENYTPADTSRNGYFRSILADIKPDILVVEEITSQMAVDIFENNVLKSTGVNYKAGDFLKSKFYSQYDSTNNAVFYNADKFTFISNTPIYTTKRDINIFTLKDISTQRSIILFGVHLDAGTNDAQTRADQASDLRAYTKTLDANTEYMVLGDFNTYSGSESAIQILKDQSNSGYFLDPINKLDWLHDSSIYAAIYTQATRTNFNNWNYGGLDDRFDLILVSPGLMSSGGIDYISNSYTTYGNDGQHFNLSINEAPTNTAVSAKIADALYYASDHLPVYAEVKFDNTTAIENKNGFKPETFKLFQNYPNPFNPATTIEYSLPESGNIVIKIFNPLGQEIKTLVNQYQQAGIHRVKFNAKDLQSGVYFYQMKTGNFLQTRKMLLMK